MGQVKAYMMELQTNPRAIVLEYESVKPCEHHDDVLIYQQNGDADGEAFTHSPDELHDAIQHEIDEAYDECPKCV